MVFSRCIKCIGLLMIKRDACGPVFFTLTQSKADSYF